MDGGRSTAGENLSTQWLEERFAEAVYCDSTRIGGKELRALLDLAAQAKAYRISGLQHLSTCCDQEEVRLSGTEMRLLLMLAKQAKRRALRKA